MLPEKGHALYVVNSIKDLCNVIIPHFDKYPLLTIKRVNFILFKEILTKMNNKEHLTEEGLQRIMSIRVAMNKKTTILGYSGTLSEIDVPEMPLVKKTDITPEWLTGFTDAEGCFFLNIRDNRNKTGYWVTAGFSLAQHSRDTTLFKMIQDYLGYGNVYEEGSREAVRLRVENFKLISEQLVPLFNQYPLQSSKMKNFLDFCLACEIIKTKAHLTEDGIKTLKSLKSGMNTGRNN